jgi:hypothetical protein
MGEIADDMIDGTSCELCGCYFINPKNENTTYTHGYPVVCWDCWNELTSYDKQFHRKSEVSTL